MGKEDGEKGGTGGGGVEEKRGWVGGSSEDGEALLSPDLDRYGGRRTKRGLDKGFSNSVSRGTTGLRLDSLPTPHRLRSHHYTRE